jgi:trans-aconitate methyltransferase
VSTGGELWRELLQPRGAQADAAYHFNAREDLISEIDRPPRLVLDVGCAAGATGTSIKKRFPDARVVGLETHPAAAAVAAQRLDGVIRESVEAVDLAAHGIGPGELDLIIAGDVLEHLANPWGTLDRLRPYLGASGKVIASVPNARNLVLISDLLEQGEWRYERMGLLDITHLRFFTARSFRRLFEETGFRVERTAFTLDARLAGLREQCASQDQVNLQAGRFALQAMPLADLEELCAWQIIVVASVAA